jgi:hypothetical protein
MLAKELKPEENIWGEPGGDRKPGKEYARIPAGEKITLKIHANFVDNIDEADFYYLDKDRWIKFGITQKLYFRLDHFVGSRFGLFLFSTKETGGFADFNNYKYKIIDATN